MAAWDELDRELLRTALLPLSAPAARKTARPAAVAALLAPSPHGVQLLLIRRAERAGDPWSGHMALPGGHAELQDSDLLATAVRETREELGVQLDPERHALGTIEDLSPLRSMDLLVRPFVFALETIPALDLSAEVAEASWISVRDIPGPSASVAHEVRHNAQTLAFPSFRVGDYPVWGFTYRVIHSLLDRVARAKL